MSVSEQKRTVPTLGWRLLLVSGLFALAGMAQFATANELTSPYALTHINNKAGLPQNAVRGVLTDHDGYLWVGTEKGLARFDGNRFVNFSEIIPGIPEDVSLGLQLDSQNRIWTAWYSHSLRVLSANRNDVIILKPAEGQPNDLQQTGPPRITETDNGDIFYPGRENIYHLNTNNEVTSISIESPMISTGIVFEGQVIYGTRDGLVLINTETNMTSYVDVPVYAKSPHLVTGNTSMVTATANKIIFCHLTGVFSYRPRTAKLTRLPTDAEMVISSCKQVASKLLIGLTAAGSEYFELVTLDLISGKLVPNQPGLPQTAAKFNSVGLHDTFVDSNNYYWVLLGGTLYQSNGPEGSYQAIDLPDNPFGLEDVFTQGHSGTVWLRTDDSGLASFSRYSNRFQTVVPPSSVSQSSQFRSMAVDQDDNIWVANDGQKLLYWNRKDNSWTNKLPGNIGIIGAIEILSDGTVWVNMPGVQKLIGYNPQSDSWEYEYKVKQPSWAMSETPDGHLLIVSENYLTIIDPYSGRREKVLDQRLPGQPRVLKYDRDENIWIGSHETGLRKVDTAGQVTSWTRENSALTSNNIFSLHFDTNDLLWIGTWHGGLLSFNPDTEEFRQYGVQQGLPDSTVFGILEDDSGYLWLSTYSGLVRFEPCVQDVDCQPEITVFDHHDGLQGDEFDANSHFRSQRGEMFFSGSGGLNTFYPEEIRVNKQPPDVRISRMQLNGAPLPGADSEFSCPEAVTLPYEFGELGLEVAVLDFNNPQKNQVQYRDLSNSDTWRHMEQPVLLIRGLHNGTHTFQFRGSNNDGIWSTQLAEIKVHVTPPFYRHPLTLVLYLLLIIVLPLQYFRSKQEQLFVQQIYLQDQVEKRTHELELANSSRERFFANVSHEICSPVHMILLMLENHMQEASVEDKNIYKSATGYAAQLMVYLKQLVGEARSHEVDSHLYSANLDAIIKSLVITNQPIAKARAVSLTVGTLPTENVAFYGSSAISIFSNLLCNALVYTPENGVIEIEGEVANGYYTLNITNTISKEQASDIEHIFERGARGDFNANYFGGHGLGLSIVTSAVEVLGGHIDVSMKGNDSIVFTVELPLADPSMSELPDEGDLAFSYEQMLAIKLIADNEEPLPARKKPVNGVSVLVIEDDVLVANLISQSLATSYTVYVAGSYTDGVRLARKHQPNVILCDLFLPGQSGFDILKAVRANRMTMDTFFVMVTASISEADRIRAQELGVDQFIRKPISSETLRLLIKNHLDLAEQRSEHLRKEQLIRKARMDKVQNVQFSFEERLSEALEEMYQDPHTTIENLQTRLSMSYASLMRHCKKAFGKSPKRLLIEKRIDVAKDLLISSEYKVGLISELAGFSTHSQFAIVFKRETGTTPVAFRKSL